MKFVPNRTTDGGRISSSLTQTLQDSLPPPLVAAMLLQAGQPADTGEAQLLVDEEEEDSQRHDEDAHGGQEADGLGGDWQQEGEGEGTHNDTLIRQHKQTAWIHTQTHTHSTYGTCGAQRQNEGSLVRWLASVPCSRAQSVLQKS